MRRRTALFLCFAAALLVPGQARAQAVDVTGKWDVSINTGQEIIPALLTLNKEGDKITGGMKDGRAPDRGEAPVQATLTENKINIAFDYADAQNGAMHIVMNGTVQKDAMSGTIEFGAMGSGEWSAKRSTASGGTPAAAQAKDAKVDVSGTWTLAITTSEFSASPTAVLKQDGEKLTGQYVSAQYGSFPLQGTVKGNQVSWSVAMTVEGNSLTAQFTGILENGAITGTVNYGGFSEGTFSAKKR